MHIGPTFRLALACALGVAVSALAGARAAEDPPKKDKDKDKGTSQDVRFDAADGVELHGTYYPPDPAAKAKSACVLLLHNFDKAKGGNSHQEGWEALATDLQKDGYAVLSFDFRGHGDSKNVKEAFWNSVKNPHNINYVKTAAKAPDTIDRQDFAGNAASYFPYFVNDVAAAKDWLDNNAGGASGRLIVIGAGEGATVGALWMSSECHRQRAKLQGNQIIFDKAGLPDLEEPEGSDLVGAVWLNISPTLGGRSVGEKLHTWLADVAGDNKVPMAFLFGAKDGDAETHAKRDVAAIKEQIEKKISDKTKVKQRMELTFAKGIEDTELSGSDLLKEGLGTAKKIKEDYLPRLLDNRPEKKKTALGKEDIIFWTFPGRVPYRNLANNPLLVPLEKFGVVP
jgi:alpha-beta hydrolase superfamily lysophospholipase